MHAMQDQRGATKYTYKVSVDVLRKSCRVFSRMGPCQWNIQSYWLAPVDRWWQEDLFWWLRMLGKLPLRIESLCTSLVRRSSNCWPRRSRCWTTARLHTSPRYWRIVCRARCTTCLWGSACTGTSPWEEETGLGTVALDFCRRWEWQFSLELRSCGMCDQLLRFNYKSSLLAWLRAPALHHDCEFDMLLWTCISPRTHAKTSYTQDGILRHKWHQSVDQPLAILFGQRLRCGYQRVEPNVA